MKEESVDISGKLIEVDDQIFYATTHGTLQIGRVIEISGINSVKVIGKGNKRELKIKDTSLQVSLKAKGYYINRKIRRA